MSESEPKGKVKERGEMERISSHNPVTSSKESRACMQTDKSNKVRKRRVRQ